MQDPAESCPYPCVNWDNYTTGKSGVVPTCKLRSDHGTRGLAAGNGRVCVWDRTTTLTKLENFYIESHIFRFFIPFAKTKKLLGTLILVTIMAAIGLTG
jgi:hypothetical protein